MVNSIVISAADEETKKNLNDVYSLDEAIEETSNKCLEIPFVEKFDLKLFDIFQEFGKGQIILTFLTGFALLGASMENLNVSYILPHAKCDLNLSKTEQGILSSISFLGIVCTSHIWGILADTWGRQKVICVASFGGFIFSFISGWATSTLILILCRFCAGAL